MATKTIPNYGSRIVTVNSMPELSRTTTGGLESARPEGAARRMLLERHRRIMEKLRSETEQIGSSKVMVTVQDRDVSRMQSELARQAKIVAPLATGGLEAKFGTGMKGGDWLGWVKSTLDWVDRDDAHPPMRPSPATASKCKDNFRIAMTADWGTNLYGAPEIARQMVKQGPFDLLLHLGDVYYSGTTDEVQERMVQAWPKQAGALSRALNGNHEMYSGGFGYFDVLLPAFRQESSYFAFQNKHWLLMFLDTAYVDHDLDGAQLGWINTVLGAAAGRKVVFFSHQQLFSRLDHQGEKLKDKLEHILLSKVVTAWYWGHEHQCVLYDTHPEYNMVARCLGNGGIPEPRIGKVKKAPIAKQICGVSWNRLSKTKDSPSCLVLDGPNAFIKGEEKKFVPHGFMTLDFDGPALTERVFLADGVELYANKVA